MPIESAFSQVKQAYKKLKTNAIATNQKFDVAQIIDKAFKVITPKAVQNQIKKCLSYLDIEVN